MRATPFRTELRQLLRLAGPLAAAQAGTQIMSLVDLAVVGRLGARELGAAGLGEVLVNAGVGESVEVHGLGVVTVL